MIFMYSLDQIKDMIEKSTNIEVVTLTPITEEEICFEDMGFACPKKKIVKTIVTGFKVVGSED